MPYIKKELRKKNYLILPENVSEGEMNFIITKLLLQFEKQKGKNYATYNSIIGILECCKQEFYRKRISEYEDKKVKENGEVYE